MTLRRKVFGPERFRILRSAILHRTSIRFYRGAFVASTRGVYLIAPPGDENVSVNDAEVAPVARSEAFTSTYGLPIGDAYCVVPTAFVSVAPDVSPSSAIETMPGIAVAPLFVTVIVCVTVVPLRIGVPFVNVTAPIH